MVSQIGSGHHGSPESNNGIFRGQQSSAILGGSAKGRDIQIGATEVNG